MFRYLSANKIKPPARFKLLQFETKDLNCINMTWDKYYQETHPPHA